MSKRQTVLFLLVDQMNMEHKDLDTIDLGAPRLARYMHKAWKKHQNTVYWVDVKLAPKKGLKFYQTRSNAIILYCTLPAYCIPSHVSCDRCVWLFSLRFLNLLSYHTVFPTAHKLHLPGCGGQIPCALPPMRTSALLPSTTLSQKHHQNSTRRPQEGRKKENCCWRGKKERNFGHPLFGPHLKGPVLRGSIFLCSPSPLPFGAHRSGPSPFGTPCFLLPDPDHLPPDLETTICVWPNLVWPKLLTPEPLAFALFGINVPKSWKRVETRLSCGFLVGR